MVREWFAQTIGIHWLCPKRWQILARPLQPVGGLDIGPHSPMTYIVPLASIITWLSLVSEERSNLVPSAGSLIAQTVSDTFVEGVARGQAWLLDNWKMNSQG